jgi:HlyD family secretion protein
MNKRVVVIGVLAFAALVAAWLLANGEGADPGSLRASGTVEATEAHLGFSLPGRVAEITAVEGRAVRAGDELARLDTRDLDAQVAAARADVEAARATLAELESGARPQEVASTEAALRAASSRAAEAEENAARATTLFEGGAISRQARDRAWAERDMARAAADQAEEALALVREGPRREVLQVARARLEQARARLETTEVARSNGVVTAPFDGVVTIRHREPGEAVGAGAPVVTLIDLDDRWVRIYIPEDRMGGVTLGAPASIVSDTYPDRTVEGEVVFIGSEAEFTPRNVQTEEERIRLVYPVKVRIIGDAEVILKPGLPADVTLRTEGP